jgi:hypothetical protein
MMGNSKQQITDMKLCTILFTESFKWAQKKVEYV